MPHKGSYATPIRGEGIRPNMATDIITYAPAVIALPEGLPDIITAAGDKTAWRFVEFLPPRSAKRTDTPAMVSTEQGGEGNSDRRAVTERRVPAWTE